MLTLYIAEREREKLLEKLIMSLAFNVCVMKVSTV